MTTNDPWQVFYRTLAAMGFPIDNPTEASLNMQMPGVDGTLSVAFPKMMLGFARAGVDNADAFRKAGWHVVELSPADVLAAAPLNSSLIAALTTLHVARSRASANASTSHLESVILEKILERGVAIPNRNVEFRDPDTRQLITSIDFAWADERLAVFVDGDRFHSDGAAERHLATLTSPAARASFKQAHRDEVARDSNARAEATARGWTCITITETSVMVPGTRRYDDDRLNEQADKVARAWSSRRRVA